MPDVTWTHPFHEIFLRCVPKDVESVLDVGCGRGIVGALLKIYRKPQRIVGVDIFGPYLDFCKETGIYTQLIQHDLKLTPLAFGPSEFDLSVALEVLEHLPKPDGRNLLNELERVSKRVIVSTPNHHVHQSSYDGDAHQQHLSRWTVTDFRKRGYSVIGVGDLMVFGRELPYLSYVLGRTTLLLPALSSIIMAVHSEGQARHRWLSEELQRGPALLRNPGV